MKWSDVCIGDTVDSVCFFFSSRRRHTRFDCDWSSDVCSSDLGKPPAADVKLARGGIRDIEFLVQCLQRLHGGREPWVRHGGTVFALGRLRDKGLLSDSEYARLAAAYRFLRYLEHRVQMEEDRQTHTLPAEPDRLDLLAAKMPQDGTGAR